MISKETLGRRVRDVRQRRKMTLKDVESTSGLSSTHISEIERGMTSPTIGALIRIAHALGKDPSYFIEERELDEICVTSDEDRPDGDFPINGKVEGGAFKPLTRGILGGRLAVHEIRLDAAGIAELSWLRAGEDACFYCIEGKARVIAGAEEMSLLPGDSIHGTVKRPPQLVAGEGQGCRVVVIADQREELR